MTTRGPLLPILTLAIRSEADVVLVRQRARVVAELLGFDAVDQTRIATAVSEISRNALVHGGGGQARFATGGVPAVLRVQIDDHGSVAESSERSVSVRSSGVGLQLARRLMDSFETGTGQTGGSVVMAKRLPDRETIQAEEVGAIVEELLRRPPESLLEELNQQHQELLAVLEDLNRQQEALRAANAELEETNRGVMALYAEVTKELDDTNRGVMALYAQLEDQADELRRVSAVKDRFLSHLSHEFRTPLNATLALSRLLIDHVDGPLSTEQDVQVRFIRQGAEDLLEMVNDLLDIAKIEAGRMELRLEEFDVDELLGALRGMFRPSSAEAGLELVIMDADPAMPSARTDRGKLAQVLRNLLSNAIKYTRTGSVRLEVGARGDEIIFDVIDTGVGIPADELDLVFEEFTRGGSRDGDVPGTGLGLPLSRELARLLGGELTAESEPGRGSTFRLRIPARLAGEVVPSNPTVGAESSVRVRYARPDREERPRVSHEDAPVVLVIDDDEPSRYVVAQALAPTGCRVVHAVNAIEGIAAARRVEPAAIFLDLILPDKSGFDVLRILRDDPGVADCPIVIYTARPLTEEQSRMLNGFTLRIVRKSDPSLIGSITTIGDALARVRTRSRGKERER